MSGEGQTEEYSTVNNGQPVRTAVYIDEKLSEGCNSLQQPFMDMFRFSPGWVQGEHTRKDLQTLPLYMYYQPGSEPSLRSFLFSRGRRKYAPQRRLLHLTLGFGSDANKGFGECLMYALGLCWDSQVPHNYQIHKCTSAARSRDPLSRTILRSSHFEKETIYLLSLPTRY